MKTIVDLNRRVYKERVLKELEESEAQRVLGGKVVSLSIIAFGNSTIEYCAETKNKKYILVEFNPLKRDRAAYQSLFGDFIKYHSNFVSKENRKIDVVDITGYHSVTELYDEGALSFEQAEKFMDEVSKIHDMEMLHLGIAPYNVFFKGSKCIIINNDSLVLKNEIENKKAKYFSATPFSAPEIRMRLCEKFNENTDVYSVCVLLKHFFNLDEHHMESVEKGLQPNIARRYANLAELKLALAEGK